jgi:hypothetical protein
MGGFLDPNAVSTEAEYTRYLDPDVLGKIILKNFAVNVLAAAGRVFDLSVWPHQPAFLERCGFYITPRFRIRVNTMDVTIRRIPERPDDDFFAWGSDVRGLRRVWDRAVQMVKADAADVGSA